MVLTVRIDLHGVVVAHALRVLVAGAHGGTHTHVVGQVNHKSARLTSHSGGVVGGAVIDHHQVHVGYRLLQFSDAAGQCFFLVPGGHNHQRTR